MQADELLRKIDSTAPARIYLFWGNADYLMEEAWIRLVERLVPRDAKHFGAERFHAKDATALQIIERLTTLPMFGNKRLFLIERIENWNKAERDILKAAIPRISKTTCLIVTAAQKKGIEDFISAVEAAGEVVQFRAPDERDAPRWLVKKAGEKGKVLSPMAATFMVELTGADFYRLESELDKLCAYTGEEERIDVADVEQVVGGQRSFSIFDLLDQVRQRQAGKAAASLRSLLVAGEAPLKILAMLAWNVRQLWQVKEGLDKGLSEDAIAGLLKMKPFAVKKAGKHAAAFSDAELFRIHRALCETDVAIKSLGTAPELILEKFVFGLCLE
jgi:DNA polymerase-3 subunit delta